MKALWIALGLMLASTPAHAQVSEGQDLYQLNCKKCHGVLGVPPKTIQKKMEKIVTFNADFLAKWPEDSIIKVLTKGGKSEDMKSFKEKLTPAQMAAVAKYVRELAAKPHNPAS